MCVSVGVWGCECECGDVHIVAILEDWQFWKKQLVLRNSLSYEQPMHIKQCPNGCSLRNITNHLKLIGSSTCSFHFRLIEICIRKIKNAGNFRIDGICNDQRWSFDGTYWELSSYLDFDTG